uniref:CalliFMRFamide-8 n=1 Tax=Calliphora vomitoria TaxID=27454 RepID=FAR8_CALVO|nr:RecName: Full=CalliFMRFamide-8 [Calliphora vomitoria]
GANDFMRF